jgi:hypothetical protein
MYLYFSAKADIPASFDKTFGYFSLKAPHGGFFCKKRDPLAGVSFRRAV